MEDEKVIMEEQLTPAEEQPDPSPQKKAKSRIQMPKGLLVILLCSALLLGALLSGWTVYLLSSRGGVPMGDGVLISKDTLDDYNYLSDQYDKLDYLLGLVENYYYIKPDREKLMEGVYRGLFDALDDPYSEYYTAEELKRQQEDTAGEFYGIGVRISNQDNQITVIKTIANSPASDLGVLPGDIIVEVDGVVYDGEAMDDAVSHMRGEASTVVEVTMLREGERMEYTFLRRKIVEETVFAKMLPNNIGYIRVESFEKNTSKDFKNALKNMEASRVSGLVVDLRSNPGGLVDQSVALADEFLPACTVVTVRDQAGNEETYSATFGKTDLKTVFLCDGNSASASEIFLAAMKDYEVGTIVGTNTFGKGIVQTSGDYYGDGTGLKMTIYQYFSPNGSTIHKIGVAPHVVIDYKEDIGPEDYDKEGVLKYESDPQLQKAVELLQ